MDKYTAIADQTRRKIIELISPTEGISAGDISTFFDCDGHQRTSLHLQKLLISGLVERERISQRHIYRLNFRELGEVGNWVADQLRHKKKP